MLEEFNCPQTDDIGAAEEWLCEHDIECEVDFVGVKTLRHAVGFANFSSVAQAVFERMIVVSSSTLAQYGVSSFLS